MTPAPPTLTLWPDPEQWICRACGIQLDTPRHVSTYQIQNRIGFWTAPPPGWLCLVIRAADPTWVCSEECAHYFDAAEDEHGKRNP